MPEEVVNTENGSHHEEETDLESAIIQQVEYYFGDSNLPRDKFLSAQVKLDEGWVPIEVLTRFNRLANLTKDVDVIATALNKASAGLIEVSDDNKKVRRNPEMPVPEMNEERRKEVQGRTVYAKGFPKDSQLDDLIKYFKTHGEVLNVVMRRYLDKPSKERKFKGSVFVTFKNKEEADKFVASKDVKFNDTELIIRWQEEYLTDKQEEYLARKEKKQNKNKDSDKKEQKEEMKLPNGTVLHFSEATVTTSREHVKEALAAIGGEVAYIDFKLGDTEGWVRLAKEDSAKELITKIEDGKLKIGDADVKFRLLEGEEEQTYITKTIEEMSKKRQNRNKHGHGHGKFNKGGFKGKGFQGRKRKQDNHSDAPAQKVKADS